MYFVCNQAAREDPEELSKSFPPLHGRDVPLGDVFTSCNWVLRDGSASIKSRMDYITDFIIRAPKTASKRVFLITDNDDPLPSIGKERLITSARTTLIASMLHFQ